MQTLVEVKNVSKSYASHRALDHLDMTIPSGSVYGLLGPNGAGKTSLIRIINQITGPDTGEIRFKGELLNPSHTKLIGYLPEERGLYKKMEVGEQALYLAQLKGLSRSEALRRLKPMFEKFDIAAWWRKKVEELSKGMQQKIQFIVTVVHEPELLILDEPFTGFDPINANLIRDELLLLNKQGTTIVLSTHRMESVEELCSHITLIDKAHKLLEGPVKEIRRSYRSNVYEIEYEGNNIALANSLWGAYELTETENHGDYRSARIRITDDTSTNQLLQNLIQNVTVHSFREMIPGMNDIFIQTVRQSESARSYA